MTARDVLRRLRDLGCQQVRQTGSHVRVECPDGDHKTTVPVHAKKDLKPGTLRGIERDLPCLGDRWLR